MNIITLWVIKNIDTFLTRKTRGRLQASLQSQMAKFFATLSEKWEHEPPSHQLDLWPEEIEFKCHEISIYDRQIQAIQASKILVQ